MYTQITTTARSQNINSCQQMLKLWRAHKSRHTPSLNYMAPQTLPIIDSIQASQFHFISHFSFLVLTRSDYYSLTYIHILLFKSRQAPPVIDHGDLEKDSELNFIVQATLSRPKPKGLQYWWGLHIFIIKSCLLGLHLVEKYLLFSDVR